MARPTERTVLACLSKKRLIELDRHFDLGTPQPEPKAEFVETLANSKGASFQKVLEELSPVAQRMPFERHPGARAPCNRGCSTTARPPSELQTASLGTACTPSASWWTVRPRWSGPPSFSTRGRDNRSLEVGALVRDYHFVQSLLAARADVEGRLIDVPVTAEPEA